MSLDQRYNHPGCKCIFFPGHSSVSNDRKHKSKTIFPRFLLSLYIWACVNNGTRTAEIGTRPIGKKI
jgi:hypothetical protein